MQELVNIHEKNVALLIQRFELLEEHDDEHR
jgi:hypothetical protein